MVKNEKRLSPQTLKEHNTSRLMNTDILSGKQFRRLKRKKK